jgi:hypothetical protein
MLKSLNKNFKTAFSHKNLLDVDADNHFFLTESVANVFVKCVDVNI